MISGMPAEEVSSFQPQGCQKAGQVSPAKLRDSPGVLGRLQQSVAERQLRGLKTTDRPGWRPAPRLQLLPGKARRTLLARTCLWH